MPPLSFSEVLHGERIKIVNYNRHVNIAILTFADSLAWLLAAFSLSCVSPAFLYNLIFFSLNLALKYSLILQV